MAMRVGIVGGGISGLYSALLLQREGHDVTIFEAADRLGGRIFTHYFPRTAKGGTDGKQAFFEAGAMRIPRSARHNIVFDLFRFVNAHGDAADKVETIPYILEHEDNKAFTFGKKTHPDDTCWARDLGLPQSYWGKSARSLLHGVLDPWFELLHKDFDTGFAKLLEYDDYSFRAYLRTVVGWPCEVVDFVELMLAQSNQYQLSFIDIVLQNMDFNTSSWVTVRGGMSRLVNAAAALVGHDNIHLNSRIDQVEDLGRDSGVLLASHRHESNKSAVFDKAAIVAIESRPTWHFMKEQGLRSLHYEPLYKIGLHFRSRFWERSLSTPIFGGQSATDLRFRWIVFPSNDLGSDGSGVLLLYAWMTDAARWMSLSKDDRVRLCMRDLQRYFADEATPIDLSAEFIEAFDVMWSTEQCLGDAMFLPGQFSAYHKHMVAPEGNIHFAGEHLSRHHTWIAGALESSLVTVRQLLECAGRTRDLAPLGRDRRAPAVTEPPLAKL